MEEHSRLALATALAILLSLYGYRKRSLSSSGAVLAFFVGLITCTASVRFGLTLITFFLSSSRITRIGAARKRQLEERHHEGGNRNAAQVLANGGLGTAIALCFLIRTRAERLCPELPLDWRRTPWETALQAAFVCQYACVNADTWASELGVLSRGWPRLVTSLRPVPPGTNGGISLVGTAASGFGGLLIGATFWALGVLLTPTAGVGAPVPPAQWPLLVLGTLAGFGGSLVDSLLGATLQFSGFCEERRRVVDHPSSTTKQICGRGWLSNDQVNFLAALTTAGAGTWAAKQLIG